MKELTTKEIITIMRGKIIKGKKNRPVRRVVTNVRQITDNTLLINLNRRQNFIGLLPGQKNVIVTDIPVKTADHVTVVMVDDIADAYWEFVRYYRGLFNIPVIGITGTCGKTTTTEMVRTILAKKYKTKSTYGNNAWYISLPYLLAIDETVEAAVYEMGVGAPGHLRYICRHHQPQVGVLTNIGTYHLLGCKTQENYIQAKAELLEGLNYKGKLILNADDEFTKKIDLSPFKGKVIYFGMHNPAHFTGHDVKYANEGIEFKMVHRNHVSKVYVPGFGEHNAYNALAAIAAASAVGIKTRASIEALASYKPVRQHMQLRSGINGCTIIDDTWNCTPPSMQTGLKVLKRLGASRETVAVLGCMPQLGAAGKHEYARMGEISAKIGINFLVIVGEEAGQIGRKAIETGFDSKKVFFCSTADELYHTLDRITKRSSMVLFKFPYKYRLSKDASYREFMKKVFSPA